MKKKLVLWLLVLLCGLGAVAYVYTSVEREGEKVIITEHVLEGDPRLAEGITMRIRSQYMDVLTWDTVFQVGQEELAQTEQRFLTQTEQEQRTLQNQMKGYQENGIRIQIWPIKPNGVAGGSIGDVESYAKENQGAAQLKEILQEAEALCELGEDVVKTFWLKDYYTYYPFYATLSNRDVLPGILRQGEVYVPADYSEWETILSQELQKYFRIPILEDDRLTVIIEKDAKGRITELSTNGRNDQIGFSNSTMTDTGLYFTLGMSPETFDYSQVPGGYGIYYLPTVEREGRLCVVPEEIDTVCALDPACDLGGLWDDESGQTLVYITQEGETSAPILNVVDMDTMKVVQRLGDGISPEWSMAEAGTSKRIADIIIKEDFMVVDFYDNHFLVYEMTPQGIYEFCFASETYIPEGEEAERLGVVLPFHFTASDMDFNGEYLAVTGFVPISEEVSLPSCDAYLALYGADGVAYYGIYQNSLSSGTDENGYFYQCEPDGMEALTLAWSK